MMLICLIIYYYLFVLIVYFLIEVMVVVIWNFFKLKWVLSLEENDDWEGKMSSLLEIMDRCFWSLC